MLAEVGLTERVGLESDSGIKHLARSLCFSRWKESEFMALAAYFDASGHPNDQNVVAVAGFLSSASEWDKFEQLWTERLKRDGITCFHAVDFEWNRGEFTEWKGDAARKFAFISDLMVILKRHVFRKFGSVVINQALTEHMSEAIKKENYINAYSLAGRTCVTHLWKWMREVNWKTVPQLVFERGDKGSDKLRAGLIQDEFPDPIFKPKKDRILKNGLLEQGVVALQAADWLAYESFVTHKAGHLDRWARTEFESTPGEIMVYLPSGLQEMQTILESNSVLTARMNEIAKQRAKNKTA